MQRVDVAVHRLFKSGFYIKADSQMRRNPGQTITICDTGEIFENLDLIRAEFFFSIMQVFFLSFLFAMFCD